MPLVHRSGRMYRGLFVAVSIWVALQANAVVVRRVLEPGAYAQLNDGVQLYLQCNVPAGPSAKEFLQRFLLPSVDWKLYSSARSVPIPFSKLKPAVQRGALLAVFEKDYVDDDGWHHTVLAPDASYRETLWSLCQWLTGKGSTAKQVMATNKLSKETLQKGQQLVIPKELLTPEFRRQTPERIPPPPPSPLVPAAQPKKAVPPPATLEKGAKSGKDARKQQPAIEPIIEHTLEPEDLLPEEIAQEPENGETKLVDPAVLVGELTYTPETNPQYAVYRLKKGEALYTAVVVRFTNTDLSENANESILEAAAEIARVSKIKDVRSIDVGQRILIPIEMLADRYKPNTDIARMEFEENLAEAKRLKGKVTSKGLEGVVVLLDPGHGGRDQGAKNMTYSIYEDEVNYDIACRVKQILESQTRARVVMTMLDPDQGHKPTNRKQFVHDTDEAVLTTPRYRNEDAKFSANLRWILSNSIYREELKKKTDKAKMVFVSVHTDSLFNDKLRGAMVYIPGARYRKNEERAVPSDAYRSYTKSSSERVAVTTTAERKRDEALSRNFAESLLREMNKRGIKTHSQGDPIRTEIRQSGGKVYVPAVLRGTLIPTKVLVETANLRNDADCKRLQDPNWRQSCAEAIAAAVRTHFGA